MRQTGNQQAKVSDVEYGWVAGFFDGEGCIGLAIRPSAAKNGGPKVQPYAKISSTDSPALNALTVVLDRAGIGYHVAWSQPRGQMKNGKSYKTAWTISIVGHRRCLRFLRWLTPILQTKRERAELALDYVNSRLSHSDYRTPITEHEWGLAMRMRQLNLKGKGQPFDKAVKLNAERPGASSERLAENGRKGAAARWGARD